MKVEPSSINAKTREDMVCPTCHHQSLVEHSKFSNTYSTYDEKVIYGTKCSNPDCPEERIEPSDIQSMFSTPHNNGFDISRVLARISTALTVPNSARVWSMIGVSLVLISMAFALVMTSSTPVQSQSIERVDATTPPQRIETIGNYSVFEYSGHFFVATRLDGRVYYLTPDGSLSNSIHFFDSLEAAKTAISQIRSGVPPGDSETDPLTIVSPVNSSSFEETYNWSVFRVEDEYVVAGSVNGTIVFLNQYGTMVTSPYEFASLETARTSIVEWYQHTSASEIVHRITKEDLLEWMDSQVEVRTTTISSYDGSGAEGNSSPGTLNGSNFERIQTGTTVSGTVFGPNNQALENATVILNSEKRVTRTDETGSYSIRNVTAGNHSLTVIPPASSGYAIPESIELSVTDTGEIRVQSETDSSLYFESSDGYLANNRLSMVVPEARTIRLLGTGHRMGQVINFPQPRNADNVTATFEGAYSASKVEKKIHGRDVSSVFTIDGNTPPRNGTLLLYGSLSRSRISVSGTYTGTDPTPVIRGNQPPQDVQLTINGSLHESEGDISGITTDLSRPFQVDGNLRPTNGTLRIWPDIQSTPRTTSDSYVRIPQTDSRTQWSDSLSSSWEFSGHKQVMVFEAPKSGTYHLSADAGGSHANAVSDPTATFSVTISDGRELYSYTKLDPNRWEDYRESGDPSQDFHLDTGDRVFLEIDDNHEEVKVHGSADVSVVSFDQTNIDNTVQLSNSGNVPANYSVTIRGYTKTPTYGGSVHVGSDESNNQNDHLNKERVIFTAPHDGEYTVDWRVEARGGWDDGAVAKLWACTGGCSKIEVVRDQYAWDKPSTKITGTKTYHLDKGDYFKAYVESGYPWSWAEAEVDATTTEHTGRVEFGLAGKTYSTPSLEGGESETIKITGVEPGKQSLSLLSRSGAYDYAGVSVAWTEKTKPRTVRVSSNGEALVNETDILSSNRTVSIPQSGLQTGENDLHLSATEGSVGYNLSWVERKGSKDVSVAVGNRTVLSESGVMTESISTDIPSSSLSPGRESINIETGAGNVSWRLSYDGVAVPETATIDISDRQYHYPEDFSSGGVLPRSRNDARSIPISTLDLGNNSLHLRSYPVDEIPTQATAVIAYDGQAKQTYRPEVIVTNSQNETHSAMLPDSALDGGRLRGAHSISLPSEWFSVGQNRIYIQTPDGSKVNATVEATGLRFQEREFINFSTNNEK